MSWRTVVIASRAKLDLSMNYLEIRGAETRRVHLSEIGILIVESTAVSLTAALLCEMVQRKIKVIFCDERRNPLSELMAFYGSHDTSAKVRQQTTWDRGTKELIWGEIVAEKIRQQQALLMHIGAPERANILGQYLHEIKNADLSNREGHAAKVYFGGLFGMDFTRTEECNANAALDYGYAILLSAFNREIAAVGYITQLGIFHNNMFNPYNLSSDLMEPFRTLVDHTVYDSLPFEFDKTIRMKLVNLLNDKVTIDGCSHYVSSAIRIYTRSALDAMNQKSIEGLRFYQNECLFTPTSQPLAAVAALCADDEL